MTDLNPLGWNWDQAKAAGKHVASYAAGGVSVAIALHLLNPAQGGDITENIGLISEGLTKMLTGFAGILAVLAPIYTSFRAAKKASPSEQIKSVVSNLSAPEITQSTNALADPQSRNKLIEAVAEMPEVKKIVSVDPAVADAIPSEKVTKS